MTAISKNIKQKAIIPSEKIHIDYKMIIVCLFSFASAKANLLDIPLAFIGLSAVFAIKGKEIKPWFILGYFVHSVVLSFGNMFYISYFIAIIIYTAVYRAFGNEKISLISSSLCVTLTKIFIVYFDYKPQYKIYGIIEGVAIYFLGNILKSGLEIIQNEEMIDNFSKLFTAFITIFSFCLGFSGYDGFMIYPSVAFALALSWNFISKINFSFAFISLLSAFLCAMDKKEFTIMFIGLFFVWSIGAYCAEKISIYIYPAVAFSSLIINLAFIYKFSGFVFVTTIVFAMIIYFGLSLLPVKIKNTSSIFTDEKDLIQLEERMNKLYTSLNFLANCAIDISKLNEKNLSGENIEDLVAESVCRNCEKNIYCWQDKYSFTYNQFSKFRKEKKFDDSFYNQCNKTEKLKQSFEENSMIVLSRKYILQSQKNNLKLLQEAFLSIAGAVGDMLYKNKNSQLVNSTATMAMDKLLDDMGIFHTYCICSRNPDKMIFSTDEPLTENEFYKIHTRLEKIYNISFDSGNIEKKDGEYICTFLSVPKYDFELSSKSEARKTVNGDKYIYFTIDGILYVILSDGMGTGAAAAAESNTVTAMTESMIKAGVNTENTVNIVNLALNIKGGSESSATLDILSVNLYDGKAQLIKAGAAESIVIGGITERYYDDSLPLGILKEIKPVSFSFTLKEDDTVLLMSDGIGKIENLPKENLTSEELCKTILSQSAIQDDKTVIAVKLKKVV